MSCHAVVRARFSTEGEWFFAYAFVDDAVGKHGLGSNAKDEGAEVGVLMRFAFGPHDFSVKLVRELHKHD